MAMASWSAIICNVVMLSSSKAAGFLALHIQHTDHLSGYFERQCRFRLGLAQQRVLEIYFVQLYVGGNPRLAALRHITHQTRFGRS